ncbi:MAG TPA: sugar phosphate nucleotidyltransferase, partial [Thermoanaerobaculia bacterium]|nr:sugar phosphate nucleotidyltransferase [Thermoanaerobaculia bacterium]
LMEVSAEETSRYGVVAGELVGDRLFKVRDMVEKPKANPPSHYAIIGRYILPPEIFPILETTKRGAGGEIQLTDALRGLVQTNGQANGGFYGYIFKGKRYDAGEKLGYLKATVDYALKNDVLGDDFAEYLRIALEKHGEEDRHPRPAARGERARRRM